MNLPDSFLSISALTKKDKKDLKFGIKYDIDFVAFSFVKTVKDVRELRNILNKNNSRAKIISKIEAPQVVENFEDILIESDGIMIASGDLAVEVDAPRFQDYKKKEKGKGHVHYDCMFVFEPTNKVEKITLQREEVNGYKWISLDYNFTDAGIKNAMKKIKERL